MRRTEHILEVGDLPVRVTRVGEGEPLVLLHGFPETSWEWRHVMPVLAERRQVLAPDLRGFGGSGKPFPPAISRSLLAEDLRLTLDTLGIGRASLVGHDWGGVAAYAFAVRHPERVQRLVLIDTTLTRVVPRAAPHVLWLQVPGLAEPMLETDGAGFVRSALPALCRTPGAFNPATIERYADPFRDPATVRLAISYYRDGVRLARIRGGGGYDPVPLEEIRTAFEAGVGRHPLWNEVLDIAPDEPRLQLSIPALWIYATGLGRPNRAFRRQFEEAFTDLKTLEIDCGHWIPEERPNELAAALREFLES